MIEIRKHLESDLEKLVELANNPNVSRYLVDSFPSPYTKEDGEWWIKIGSKEGINRAIVFNGAFVGSVGATLGDGVRKKQASIGYWLGEEYWGLGIMAVAISKLIKEIYETTEIVRIDAWIFEENIQSARILVKAGFTHEATLKNSLFKHGRLFNELIFSITR